MRGAVALIGVSVAIACAGCGRSSTYAGISRDEALNQAKRELVVMVEASSPGDAASAKRWLDTHAPKIDRSRCQGSDAWAITWPAPPRASAPRPVYVDYSGILTAC